MFARNKCMTIVIAIVTVIGLLSDAIDKNVSKRDFLKQGYRYHKLKIMIKEGNAALTYTW